MYFRGFAFVPVLIAIVLGSAWAQQTLEVPAPSGQGQPQVRPKPRPKATPPPAAINELPRQSTPEAQLTPAPASRQPVLPAVFRGCWQGRVEMVDSIARLP